MRSRVMNSVALPRTSISLTQKIPRMPDFGLTADERIYRENSLSGPTKTLDVPGMYLGSILVFFFAISNDTVIYNVFVTRPQRYPSYTVPVCRPRYCLARDVFCFFDPVSFSRKLTTQKSILKAGNVHKKGFQFI